MLSEDEICKLCKETQQKTVNYLAESERKKTERMAAFRASQKKQYQHDLERYQSQLKYYEQALKNYETNVEREETEYPERVETWKKSEEQRKKAIEQYYEQAVKAYEQALKEYEQEEIDYPERVKALEKSEEQRKQLIEQTYTQRVAAYEQTKSQREAAGLPYNVPFPQKQTFVPHPKPVMHKCNKPTEPKKQTFSPSPKPVKYKYYKPTEPRKQTFTPHSKPIKHSYHKPTEPVPPKEPDEKQSGLNSGFSSLFSMIGLMFTSSFSERTVRQLHKLDLSNPADKNKAFKIIFREMYLNQRISMECSQSEGRGISPALDGLYGEKLTVFELELCIFAGYKGNILHNLEIEVGNRTIQIDVLFITQKGIFVIESKNYSGSVFGAECQNKWTLRTHKKGYHFYNPVTQNQTHINTLSRIIRSPRFFSLVAFSERCDLEYIDIHKRDVFVFN